MTSSLHTKFLTMLITFLLASVTAAFQPLPCPLPTQLESKLRTDPSSLSSAAVDYGNIVHVKPTAVMSPSSAEDISLLVTASYDCRLPFGVAARGNGHSTRGQSMVGNGVVLDMRKGLNDAAGCGPNIRVSKEDEDKGWFADVAGGSLWIDVLNATLREGAAPVIAWTDVLTLTVGGTLSNAGIGGQAFRLGPQIVSVRELDVVTGRGEMVTCSASNNPELFNGVLGGLGQFGVITRARLALAPAPQRVKWAGLLYTNFAEFTNDQESIIANNEVDYLEGQLLLDNGTPNSWATEFFPAEAQSTIASLVKQNGIVYALELALYYDHNNQRFKNRQLKQLVKGLKNVCGLVLVKDVGYPEFISRAHIQYPNVQAHPWLNLFVPKSGISEFGSGVLTGIILQRNISTGPVLFYPMNRNKWDDKMSAVVPDEDVFYSFGLLSRTEVDDWQKYLDQNAEVLQYCEKAGIKVKQYLPNHSNQQEWIRHFGSKWDAFQRRKELFDPKFILSPGQKIFNEECRSRSSKQMQDV